MDDDIVVQKDISFLWELDLNGKVSGSVFKSWCENSCCPGNKYVNLLNFSHPIISSKFDSDKCAWLFGVNIFDLEAWRRSDITKNYHYWLKLVSKMLCGQKPLCAYKQNVLSTYSWNNTFIIHKKKII